MVAVKPSKQRGFTLLEMLIAISIAGLILATSVPAAHKMYVSMQYREAVRDVRRVLESARYLAIVTGQSADVVITPREGLLQYGDEKSRLLPPFVKLETETAAELMSDGDKAVIRFYSDGSSTGGTVYVGRNDNWISLHVGWLLGSVEQSVLEP